MLLLALCIAGRVLWVRNRAEVIIAKQRHGPTGTAHLHFQGEFTRFSDLADPDRFPEPHD